MTVDNYDPAGSLSAYYPSRAGRVIARIWAREKTLHDLADFGAVQFFEGGGSDPTALPGYATGKLWLRVDEGVTEEAATVRYYAGGTASLLASWPELDREGFAAHLGAKSAGELDLVWSTAISGDPGTGKVRGNHATLASITSIAISKTGRQGQSYSARIALMDDDDIVRVYGAGDDSSYVDVRITGAPSDQTTYYTIPCAVRAATSLSDGHLVGLSHHPTATSIDTAQDWAEKIDGAVDGANGYSSKAWAIGGTGVTNTAARGSAKDWATNAEDSTVDGSGYSSLHYAAKASAARDAALAAQAAAISASTAAEAAQSGAEAAQSGAEAAQSGAEAAQSGAEAAQSGAEAARDAAFANADVYADIATGRAAVADGEQFMVVSGDEIIRYRRDTSSTQTEMARYPTVAFLRGGRADRFTEGSGTISPSVYIAYSFVSGTTYIIDVLARHGERALLNIFTNIGPGLNVTVDLRTAFVGGGVSVTPMSDGFSFVRIVYTPTVTGSSNLQLRLCDASGNTTYAGDGTSGLWVAECAIRTEYNGANLLSSGRDFTAWTKVSTTVTADSVPAVGPIETAIGAAISAERSLALLIGDSAVNRVTETSGSVYPSVYKSVGWTSGQQYIVEVIAKAGERTRINLFCNNGCTFDVTFDLESGAVESGTGGVIEPRGDGYYLCRVTKTASATASGNLQVRVYPASGGHPYTGDGASGLYVRSADLRTSAGGASIIAEFKTWTKDNCTLTTGAAPYPGLQSVAYEALARASGAGTQHPLYGLDVSIVGTSLVAQLVMPNAFAAATGCVLQALGSSGGALGLDARGSPHYGSGAVTALLPSINAGADVIILDMLVNDVAASDVPLGTRTDTTTATYMGALANFFTWCETNRPNAAVAVVVQTAASATYSPSDYRHDVANANGNFLHEFQAATRTMCEKYGRPYIDPNRFGIGFLDSGDDTSDGLHWDTSGAVRIAKIYAAETRRLADAGWI